MADDLGVQYRDAKAAVLVHVARWAEAERAVVDWLKTKRGVPSHLLYDAKTGDPLDPELVALVAAVSKAEADVQWCRGLVVACGEVIKDRPFAEVLADQRPQRRLIGMLQ